MDSQAIVTQLRSLATEYRNKADFFDLASDLHEQGYKSDLALIATEVQKVRDEKAIEVAELTTRAVTAETELYTAQEQLRTLSPISEPVIEAVK